MEYSKFNDGQVQEQDYQTQEREELEPEQEKEVQKTIISSDYQKNKTQYFLVLFLLGLLNNTGYVLVNSSAQEIANKFNETNLMGLFQFCLIIFGLSLKFLNSALFLKLKHKSRIFGVLTMILSAYIIISISTKTSAIWGFYTALVGSLLMGGSSSLGEMTNLGSKKIGFMKGFAPEIISGWSSGTGFAGVFGAGLNLILRAVQLDDFIIFLVMTPSVIIYWFGFKFILNKKVDQTFEQTHEIKSAELTENNEANINITLNWTNFKNVFPKIWWFSFNLSSVYFLEYTCTTGFASKATTDYSNEAGFLEKNSFIVLQLCYQIGVYISRSSLAIVKIQRVWILTLLQFINVIGWGFAAYYKFLNLPELFIFMIWVGLMGGASYVNVLYQALKSDDLAKKEKEIGINFISIINDIGVISSSLIVILLDNTLYQYK